VSITIAEATLFAIVVLNGREEAEGGCREQGDINALNPDVK